MRRGLMNCGSAQVWSAKSSGMLSWHSSRLLNMTLVASTASNSKNMEESEVVIVRYVGQDERVVVSLLAFMARR